MKNEIVFKDFTVSPGFISFNYVDDSDQGSIYFKLHPEIEPSNDLIAHALSTLCARNKYKKIFFDLNISEEAIKKIIFFTQSEVSANKLVGYDEKVKLAIKENIILNFSGGFDSLAAKLLMPQQKTKLVSMDFGGGFAREKEFFQTFETCSVSTNLLETELKRNSWSFMGIGSILFSEFLNAKYYTFGGILEASRHNCVSFPAPSDKNSFPPFQAVGMDNAPYVLGLTEIATAIVMLKKVPELTMASLESVANEGEEKKYRKQLILFAVCKDLNIDISLDINSFTKPRYKLDFGKSFAVDFLSFYLIKTLGTEVMLDLYNDIPNTIVNLCNNLNLDFYKKFNSNFLDSLPKELQLEFMTSLIGFDIKPYTENDWKEFKQVLRMIDELSL